MELIIFIALVAVGLVVYYNYAKKDLPSDVVQLNKIEEDAGVAPYKVETLTGVEGAGSVDVAPIITEVVETGKVLDAPKRKAAARTAAPKKTAAKKTAGAKKPAAKKKSA